jgi:hypothetical protein
MHTCVLHSVTQVLWFRSAMSDTNIRHRDILQRLLLCLAGYAQQGSLCIQLPVWCSRAPAVSARRAAACDPQDDDKGGRQLRATVTCRTGAAELLKLGLNALGCTISFCLHMRHVAGAAVNTRQRLCPVCLCVSCACIEAPFARHNVSVLCR